MTEKYNQLESNLKDIIASQSFHFKKNFDIFSYFFTRMNYSMQEDWRKQPECNYCNRFGISTVKEACILYLAWRFKGFRY